MLIRLLKRLLGRGIPLVCLTLTTFMLTACKAIVLDPKGLIAIDERRILITSVCLMLLIVIPVIIIAFATAWRYRASNIDATYSPNWAHNTALEVVWWSIPCLIIVVLATITWITSHRLDPYRPIPQYISTKRPLIIEAIALQWKWLFIYPEQHIASVNYLQIPVDTPVQFFITAEGPMNGFQVPQLGSQIYAMAGMRTQLHLITNHPGLYRGVSTNFTGEGFSDMKFSLKAGSQTEFDAWVAEAKKSKTALTMSAYGTFMQPSKNVPIEYFSHVDPSLFDTVILTKMLPPDKIAGMKKMLEMNS